MNNEKISLAPEYSISRVIKGGWQMSSGHTMGTQTDREKSVEDTIAFIRRGITTMDFGDIYLGVEEMIGKALAKIENEQGKEAKDAVRLHTKYVPDLSSLESLCFRDVGTIIHRSRKRLGVERLDLVQFHWWDYGVQGYVEAMQHLARLQREGYIRHLGVTNFDQQRMREFTDAGIEVKTIQLQYSVLDSRPEKGMADLCEKNDMHMLCYGTVAGGFLSERYLDVPEPQPPFENRSLTKYKLIIDEFGGWETFQELLHALDGIAKKHGCGIGSVASAYVLSKPRVAAVIVGARNTRHLDENVRTMQLALDAGDIRSISDVLAKANTLRGDIYDLERNDPKHANIMHKHNNAT